MWIQPQADCGTKRCSPASADTYRAMVNAGYQAIHSADPAATVLIGALAPAGGDLKSRNANTRPADLPARTRLPRRQAAPGHHRRLPWLSARARRRARLPPAQHAQPARPALRHGRQRRPREPLAHRAPARPHAAVGPDPGQRRAAGHLARRVRLPDQPARQAARRVARPPGPLSAAGGVPGLARSARPAALAVPVGRRAARRRQALHRLAVGPALRRRPAQARARALRPPDVAGLREQHAVGAGPAWRRPRASRSRSASRAPGPRGSPWPTSRPATTATGRCAPR